LNKVSVWIEAQQLSGVLDNRFAKILQF